MPKLDPQVLHHPVVVAQFQKRATDVQLRIADRITAFAGSMDFVYLHALLFTIWMLVFEQSSWPTLTLIVSLEAIFLSTFVMIGHNRQGAVPAGEGRSRRRRRRPAADREHQPHPGGPPLTKELHDHLLRVRRDRDGHDALGDPSTGGG
jgi:hypothetical protein